MKQLIRIALKVILAIIFIQNIGLFSLLSNMPEEIPAPQKADGGKEDREFLNKKIEKAKNLGDKYGPEEYFADLTEIRLKTKNHDFDQRAILGVGPTTNVLLNQFNTNVINNRKLYSGKNYDNYMVRLDSAREKCLNVIDPEGQKRAAELKIETSRPNYWRDTLISLLLWLLGFYLKNMPLALVLLWLWWYEDKDKLKISNPLSFLICLILYPITIISVWRNGARIFAMSVDYKRRETDIFAMISDDELTDIKNFARSNLKISDYKRYLENRGLTYKHALAPAMMATCILLLSPKSSNAEVKHKSVNLVECQLCVKAPPDFHHADSNQYDYSVGVAIMPTLPKQMFDVTQVRKLVLPPTSKRCSGFQTNPDPVPLVA